MNTSTLRKHCPQCRQNCAASAKICPHCAYAFPKLRKAAQAANSRKTCPLCGFRAQQRAQVCSQCGHEFVIQHDAQPQDKMQPDEKACVVCGTVSRLSAKVCRQCGTRFPAQSLPSALLPASIEVVTAEPTPAEPLHPTHGEPAPDLDDQTLHLLRSEDDQIEIDLFGRRILRLKRS